MRLFQCLLMLAITLLPAPILHSEPPPGEVTLKGNLLCNGACTPDPKADDHLSVLFAIDGTDSVKADLEKIMKDYPDKGLDADAAQKMLNAFNDKLKFYIAPDSPALPDPRQQKNHYCQPAAASAVTGTLSEKDGKKWITATRIAPATLKYPEKMLAPDQPFAKPEKDPITLAITDKISLKCIAIPPGKLLMGSPYYAWPYFMEEYPHLVTLTKTYYLAEIPVTQEMWEAIMGANPSKEKGAALPVADAKFADIDKFCKIVSEKTRRTVRLPTDAEWEYAARVGTSNPGFQEKYADQNSAGSDGFKKVLPVKSKKPNAWGLYDMASCWWEITGDKGMYNVRKAETDPAYPNPRPENEHSQRNGRGLLKEGWSIVTHEFITGKGYAPQKFRVVVEEGK